jgi:hypothetical protein
MWSSEVQEYIYLLAYLFTYLFIHLYIYAQKHVTKPQIMKTPVLLQGDSLKRNPELITVNCAVLLRTEVFLLETPCLVAT